MLSYRHAFHAGNHADVLKHFVEIQLLRHLLGKDRPISYIDTHAGAGRYVLWYPNLSRPESRQLPSQLKQLKAKGWLHVTLNVRGPGPADTGMRGSGMFILNPPWGLRETLEQVMPCLADRLAQDGRANFILEHHENPSTAAPVAALPRKRGG